MIWGRIKRKFGKPYFPWIKYLNSFLISFRNTSLNFLFFCHFCLFVCNLIVFKYFSHAMFVTTFIINKNKSLFAFSANVTKNILTTTMDINIALTFKQVIMWNTFKARLFVRSILSASSNILLRIWNNC